MNLLQWHDAPSHTPKADPWFGITMGLLGLIAGYILGIVLR